MPEAIDIMVVIDAQSILAAHPDPSGDFARPTVIGDENCYLIAPPSLAHHGQATAHLALEASALDQLHWRSLSLSGNAGYSAIIYAIHDTSRPLAHPAAARESNSFDPLPVLVDGCQTEPPSFRAVDTPEYSLITTARSGRRERLSIRFYITKTDPGTGRPAMAGYFEWYCALAAL